MKGRKFSMGPPPKKQKKDSNLEMDFFSQLPDHIIVSVLSKLPLKDAVRTSVLARRWEKLWSFRLGSDIILRDDENSFTQPRHFVAWVGRILKSCRKQQVSEFAIRYELNGQFSDALKSWLVFALEKNVKRLDLDLASLVQLPFICVFPDFRNLSPEFSNLKDVCLCGIKTDQSVFQYFLSKCPSLERLCLRVLCFRNGLSFATLNVENQTLKCLEVDRCTNVVVVISAPKLISLNFIGGAVGLQLESAPLLSELSVAGSCAKVFAKQFGSNFRFATQLTTLKLPLSMKMVEKSGSYPQELTVFTVLKYLEIIMDLDQHQCLLWPICLINAAPMLHTFKVEMRSWLNTGSVWDDGARCYSSEVEHKCNGRNISTVEITGHKCLKVVECRGFTNFENQWELVEQILKISQSLEKIVLDVHAVVYARCRKYESYIKWIDTLVIDVKETAERLLAPGIKLEVINSIIKQPPLELSKCFKYC